MSLKHPVDIIFTPRPETRHAIGGGARDMLAHGICVRTCYSEAELCAISPLNSAMGTAGVTLVIPFAAVPELVNALNRMISGPLGDLLQDIEDQANATQG